mgnify:CR=1 FL=1
MLRQRMQHVVQESNSGVYADSLALRGLARMALQGRNEALIDSLGKRTTIDIDGQLDLRFVGITREDRGTNPLCFRAHCEYSNGVALICLSTPHPTKHFWPSPPSVSIPEIREKL